MAKSKSYELTPLNYVKGVGPKRAEAFAKEGFLTPLDLIYYFPKSYIDRNSVQSIKELAATMRRDNSLLLSEPILGYKLKSEITIIANIESVNLHEFGKKRKMLKIKLSDGSGGSANVLFWNGADYFKKMYSPGQLLYVCGRAEIDDWGIISFNHPEIEKIDEEDIELYKDGKILPKYRLSDNMRQAGISMKSLRTIIANIIGNEIPNIRESLPDSILKEKSFPSMMETVRSLHFPESMDAVEQAKKRIKYEEMLYFQLSIAKERRKQDDNSQGIVIKGKSISARRLYDSLPFELTSDQKRVLNEFASDFISGKPMNRLLQGDVGSGKTIVALLSMLMVIDAGYQTVLMAPTEVLAEQHYRTISGYLTELGFNAKLLTGNMKTKERDFVKYEIKSGNVNVIIGTHALFEPDIDYCNLAYVVIDEQHRFGVSQRAELRSRAFQSFGHQNIKPHILVMTATPIPRTLSMTVYGDLDTSVIKEMPKNRIPIITRVTFESKLGEVYEFVRKQINNGQQAYIVFPLVEKSEKLELKAAKEHFEQLQNDIFPEFKCGLLHGQLNSNDKNSAMNGFVSGDYQVLIATTVIEVGIDVPNANVMLINNAERFGLSQLHQLRGRVGRGGEQSYCILITKDNYRYQLRKNDNNNEERQASIIRLRTMEETTDGFRIAEVDLKLRGPGDIMGTKQSGLPDFKYVDLVNDADIITEARNDALNYLKGAKLLSGKEKEIVESELKRRFLGDINYYNIA